MDNNKLNQFKTGQNLNIDSNPTSSIFYSANQEKSREEPQTAKEPSRENSFKISQRAPEKKNSVDMKEAKPLAPVLQIEKPQIILKLDEQNPSFNYQGSLDDQAKEFLQKFFSNHTNNSSPRERNENSCKFNEIQ